MWIRMLFVAFGIALGVGLCAYVASRVARLGGRGAAGTAIRSGLLPLAIFLLLLPLLAMHGLLRAMAGIAILMAVLCSIFFLGGLVIGLWKEAARYEGPFVMDRTIALNRPVKKLFSVLMLLGLAFLLPWAFACSASFVGEDLENFALNYPVLIESLSAFARGSAPYGAAGLVVSALSAMLSLGYDWTVGAVIEALFTAIAKHR